VRRSCFRTATQKLVAQPLRHPGSRLVGVEGAHGAARQPGAERARLHGAQQLHSPPQARAQASALRRHVLRARARARKGRGVLGKRIGWDRCGGAVLCRAAAINAAQHWIGRISVRGSAAGACLCRDANGGGVLRRRAHGLDALLARGCTGEPGRLIGA
jgi:hypothetical protein